MPSKQPAESLDALPHRGRAGDDDADVGSRHVETLDKGADGDEDLYIADAKALDRYRSPLVTELAVLNCHHSWEGGLEQIGQGLDILDALVEEEGACSRIRAELVP
jgi:hypothetical protein